MKYCKNKSFMNQVKSKLLLPILSCILYIGTTVAQESTPLIVLPQIAGKANILSYATSTLQVGGEIKLSNDMTIDLSLSYNPWSFSENKKIKHFLVQAEIRYWFCEAFNGTFLGLHAHYGLFNVGGVGVSDFMKEHRHEGWLAGAGVSIGHQWILSSRWALEATIGVGYAYLDYERYPCEKCGEKIKDKTMHYLGPTRLGVSVIYVIK